MENIVERVCKTIDKYNMFNAGDKVIIGVSGGVDSTCLLHILNSIKTKYGIDLYIAHLNHKLRQEAKEDAEFVKKMGEDMNIPVFIREIDVKSIASQKGISIEMVGRNERYKFFKYIARETGSKKIATAHNMNDQAETILMRIIRGAGADGLEGIIPHREDGVVRPLIEVDRKMIEEYCNKKNLKPRIDISNLKPIYTRNKIRIDLIPRIEKEYNSNFLEAVVKISDALRMDNEFINKIVEQSAQDCIEKRSQGTVIYTDKLSGCHPAIQRRLIRKAILDQRGSLLDISHKHITEVLDIALYDKGSAVDLPGGFKVKKSYNNICIFEKYNYKKKNFLYKLKENETVFIEEINTYVTMEVKEGSLNDIKRDEANTGFFDYDMVKKDIYARNRLNGDKFVPLGMKGTKKLKDFFIDLKVPLWIRDSIPLIVSGNDILWVVGYRISDKYKCTGRTKNILIIKVSKGDL